MINSVLPLVLHALGNPELSISSVSTLKKICRECKYDLPPYAANIVAVSQVCGVPGAAGPQGTLCTALTAPSSFFSQDVLMKQIHKVSSEVSAGSSGYCGICRRPLSCLSLSSVPHSPCLGLAPGGPFFPPTTTCVRV